MALEIDTSNNKRNNINAHESKLKKKINTRVEF